MDILKLATIFKKLAAEEAEEIPYYLQDPIPQPFNLNEFKQLTNIIDIQEIGSRLSLIGKGGGRNVYDLGNEVLKIATSREGIDQNKNETEISSKSTGNIAEVVESNPNFYWIISRKIKPVADTEDLFKLFENSFNIIKSYVDTKARYKRLVERKADKKLINRVFNDILAHEKRIPAKILPFAKWLSEFIIGWGLNIDDIFNEQQWGTDESGKPILLDYGLRERN